MSTQADMLINQAQAAYDEAKRLRRMIEDRQKADRVNMENDIERAEMALDSGDTEKDKYWRDHADLTRSELDKYVRDMESRAHAKEEEGRRHESEASKLASRESDNTKKNLIIAALHSISRN